MREKKGRIYNTVCPRDCFGVCSLEVHVINGKVTSISGNKNNKNSQGKICMKGKSYGKRLYHPDRLKYPMLKDNATGLHKRISWHEAMTLISNKLRTCKEQHGYESILYLSGWGHTGIFNTYADIFWSQFGKITSTYGSLCMAAGEAAVKYTYGNTVKHNSNEDLINAKLIIVWGANPANTNIHRMRNINKAVKNGAELIVIDPRVSETMTHATLRVHPRGGTDGLLAMGIAKLLIKRKLCKDEFINKYVLGFHAYKEKLQTYTFEEISSKTDVSVDMLNKIVDSIEKNPIYALVSGSGKSRYTNGGQTERAICLLPALTGSIGMSGGGYYFTDNQQPSIKLSHLVNEHATMHKKIHVGSISEDLGKQVPEIKFMWIEKANPLTSGPNVNQLTSSMKKIDFIVVVDHFMTDTTEVADLILPAAMFAEKDDLVSVYGDSYIHLLQKIVNPYGECKSEPEIYRMLGGYLAMDLDRLPVINEKFIDKILMENNINTTYQSLTEKPYLFEAYRPIAFEDLVFETPSGKIEIFSEQMKKWHEDPLPSYKETIDYKSATYKKYPLSLLSSHAAERINSQFTELTPSKAHHGPTVQMNCMDANKRQIKNGDWIRVFNDRGELRVLCEVGEQIKAGTIHIYEGWGQKFKASVNKLTRGGKTDIGNATSFHACLVEISKT